MCTLSKALVCVLIIKPSVVVVKSLLSNVKLPLLIKIFISRKLVNSIPDSRVMFVLESKGTTPISVTELGIFNDAKLAHPSKAPLPILVTELGIVNDDKLVH